MEKTVLNLPYVEAITDSRMRRYLIINFKFYHKGKLHFAKYFWEGSSYLSNSQVSGPHRGDFPRRDHNRFLLTVLTDQCTSLGDYDIYSSNNKQVEDILTPIYGHVPEMSGGWPNWFPDKRHGIPWILNTLLPALNNLLAEKYKNLYTFDLSLEDLKPQVKF